MIDNHKDIIKLVMEIRNDLDFEQSIEVLENYINNRIIEEKLNDFTKDK
jgi:hypothetical protein